jgi:transaldolase
MSAAAQLNKEGIRVPGTSLFSLPRAIAASQAGCLYISPYFNEVAAYEDDSLMHKGSDPALTVGCYPYVIKTRTDTLQHPMAPRLSQILDAYTKLYHETGRDQPLIVIAR